MINEINECICSHRQSRNKIYAAHTHTHNQLTRTQSQYLLGGVLLCTLCVRAGMHVCVFDPIPCAKHIAHQILSKKTNSRESAAWVSTVEPKSHGKAHIQCELRVSMK